MVVVEVVTTGSGFQRAEDVEVWAASLNAVDKDDVKRDIMRQERHGET